MVKSSGATELIQAIELALVGRSYVTPRITRDDGPDKFFCHVKANQKSESLDAAPTRSASVAGGRPFDERRRVHSQRRTANPSLPQIQDDDGTRSSPH